MKKCFGLIFCAICIISGCTHDAYDKGEGKYSLMRADFVEANSNAQKEIDRITTDDGDILSASKPFKVKFVNTPDSVYRCVLYYNKVKDEKNQDVFEPISIGQVACPKIISLAELDTEMKTDPVKFESAWMSKSGKYINLSLYLMTGSSDDEEAKHTLRIVQDAIVTNPDATRTSYLRTSTTIRVEYRNTIPLKSTSASSLPKSLPTRCESKSLHTRGL